MRYGRYRLIALMAIAALALLVVGCASSSGPVSPEQQEEAAQGIDKSLMCPVCPSETIDQSQVEIAKQMRVMVREQLAQGESRATILQFFVDRYGPGVLAEPPRSGFNLLVWVIPPVALLAGGGILAMVMRGMRRGQQKDTEDDEKALPTQDLEPYLAMVDQEIRRLTLQGDVDVEASSGEAAEGPDRETFEGKDD
jgi:cytochrome c-type biogenesis protein CcmH